MLMQITKKRYKELLDIEEKYIKIKENKSCALYIDYKKSCKALRGKIEELGKWKFIVIFAKKIYLKICCIIVLIGLIGIIK